MITIFTPTYNRCHELENLYESLKKQTNNHFIWLIVDDGSADETKETVSQFQKDSPFLIEYIYQENSGKHIAYNTALRNMTTEWHVNVDSDDWLAEDAVQQFMDSIESLSEDYVGVVYPKIEKGNEENYSWLPDTIKEVTIIDIKFKHKLNIETCILIRNRFLEDFEFPKIKGENFLSEELMYIYLAQKGSFHAENKQVYFYEYLTDGLTSNIFSLWKRNPVGTLLLLDSRKNYFNSHYSGMLKFTELLKVNINQNSLKMAIMPLTVWFGQASFSEKLLFIPYLLWKKRRFKI